jgi:hypothetical protein
VGFLWGMPETFGGSRNWSFTDVELRLSGDRFAFEPGVAGGQLICPGRSALRRRARRPADRLAMRSGQEGCVVGGPQFASLSSTSRET